MTQHHRKQLIFAPLMLIAGSFFPAFADAEWINTEHDFGAFSEDEAMVKTEFKFINSGDKPMNITNARATCGCTTPEFSTAAIAPGDTATIKVAYLATGRPGRFNKKVYVSLSGNQPDQTLTISGVVVGSDATIHSRYPFDAGKVKLKNNRIQFGEVKRGLSKTIYLEGYNQSVDTITPTLTGAPGYLSILATPAAVPPGEQITYAMTIDTEKLGEWGVTEQRLQFKADKNAEPVELESSVLVTEDFSKLTPGQYVNAPQCVIDENTRKHDFGQLNAEDSQAIHTAEFIVTNKGKSPLILRRVQSLDPTVTSLKASSEKIKPGKSAKIVATIDPKLATNDIINARIHIFSNDPENSVEVVRVTAELTR